MHGINSVGQQANVAWNSRIELFDSEQCMGKRPRATAKAQHELNAQ